MVSIILTAWKEEKTIGRAVRALIEQARKLDEETQLLLVCPDDATRKAAELVVRETKYSGFIYIRDPQKGKPYALNLALKRVSGEIIVSTDGDVWVDEGALGAILAPFSDKCVGGVTGRPVCANDRGSVWGYWGHMFIDAADRKRRETLEKGNFYVMSGYFLAVRNIGWEIPEGVLDDIYFSYALEKEKLSIVYAPKAHVFVRQPVNMKDWLTQKVRSLSGHYKGSLDGIRGPVTRSFVNDLRYFFFPLQYARSPREVWWSLLQYPVRLYTWMCAWWVSNIQKKTARDIWGRAVSTK